jgi:hypothetical protein
MNRKILGLLVLSIFLLSSCSLLSIPVLISFESDCEWESLVPGDIRFFIENSENVIVGSDATSTEIEALLKEECVIFVNQQENTESIQEELNEDRDKKIREAQLDRTLKEKDIIDKDQLKDYINQENPEKDWPGGVISPYQLYVTPDSNAVQNLANTNDGIQEIYAESLGWVWISDTDLWGETEKWLYPEEFLTETADLSSNPTGEIASDCEDQANTLASALIADGMNPENVRMVLGLVDFDGTTGGHAWVQIYEDGQWIDLDATSGAYYTDETGYISNYYEIPYNYFKYRDYPSVEIWAYYNNKYYLDAETGQGNAPPSWSKTAGSQLNHDVQKFRQGVNINRNNKAQGTVIYKLQPQSNQRQQIQVETLKYYPSRV